MDAFWVPGLPADSIMREARAAGVRLLVLSTEDCVSPDRVFSFLSLRPTWISAVAETNLYPQHHHHPPTCIIMPRPYDHACMRAAIAQADKAAQAGKMPFGAVLASAEGEILVEAHNQCDAAKKRGGNTLGDVTRHAEMELVRQFTSTMNLEQRKQCTLYTSTECCVMCAGAVAWSGVSRLVYGCTAHQLEELSGPGGFDVPVKQLYGLMKHCTMDVEGPVLPMEALESHDRSGIWKNKLNKVNSAASADIAMEASLKETGLGSAEVVDDGVVPTIDLSLPVEEVTELLWKAATEVGFFVIVNHGMDLALIEAAFKESESFFQQSLEEKQAQSPVDMSINCGFEYFAQVRPSTGVADQKESLQVTARQGSMTGRWPSESFKKTAEDFLQAANELAGRLLDLLEPKATPQVEPGTLAKSHTLWGDDGQCTLRFLHYPPLDNDVTAKLLKEGYWRAGPHTDWDNVTLLFQRPGQGGLECCANPRTGNPKEMYWTAIHPVEGGIAVNIGDMLARWSDGKLHSNLHRVRLPEDASKSRYSIAFFAQSDKKTLIESKESDPITAGDYILSRIQSNFQK